MIPISSHLTHDTYWEATNTLKFSNTSIPQSLKSKVEQLVDQWTKRSPVVNSSPSSVTIKQNDVFERMYPPQ